MLSEKGAVNSFLLPDALELRASIDATVAHLLRMSEHELDYVLDSFPKIRSEQEKALGSYRSQDLTLTHLKKLNS